MPKIEELGSFDSRPCPVCKKTDMVIHFEVDGKQEQMCRSCLFEKYNYGKPHRKFDPLGTYKDCPACSNKRLKLYKDETKDQDDFIIKTWKCDKCGHIEQEHIKKWKREEK